jgi:hypothetical protein
VGTSVINEKSTDLFDFIYYLTANGRQFKKDCDFVHKVTEEIIESRKYVLVSCFLQIHINGSLLGIFSLIMFPYLKLVSSAPTHLLFQHDYR